MIVRVSVVLNITVTMDIRIPSTYDIIYECCDCHWLGLLYLVISKYVLF